MKTTRLSAPRAASAIAVAWIMIGCMFWGVDNAHGQTAPRSNLSPGLQEVVKLAQAHMGDGVILAYIKNSGTLYTLSADDILYLKDQGVSQNVITALLQSQPAGNPNVVPQSSPGDRTSSGRCRHCESAPGQFRPEEIPRQVRPHPG